MKIQYCQFNHKKPTKAKWCVTWKIPNGNANRVHSCGLHKYGPRSAVAGYVLNAVLIDVCNISLFHETGPQ